MTTVTAPGCQPRRLLVAIDFSDASGHAAALAGLIASAYDARLVALHAERFEPPPYFTHGQLPELDSARVTAAAAAADQVRAFVATRTAFPVDARVVDADPVAAILAASTDADLLVMGTHGRRGPARWWLGSVAERVVLDSAHPVLVVGASTAPPTEAFARVVVVHAAGTPHPAGRACANVLAGSVGGQVEERDSLVSCGADALAAATCVVLVVDRQSDPDETRGLVAEVLTRCAHPVLIVPVTPERSAS